jgi:hypothetical protein
MDDVDRKEAEFRQKENEMRQRAQMVKELEWVLNSDDELVRSPGWQLCSGLRITDGANLPPQSEEGNDEEVEDYVSETDNLSSDGDRKYSDID